MGGRGSSSRFSYQTDTDGVSANPNIDTNQADSDALNWQEAFQPGVDFERTGDVNHVTRTVSRGLQRQWDHFTANYSTGMTYADEAALMKEWDPSTDQLYGYVRTTNSFAINKKLYDPQNAGKSDAQVFTRRDRNGVLRDLQTVRTLDKAITTHQTQANAMYTRFCSPNAMRATFGLTPAQMGILQNAGSMSASQLQKLNQMFFGKKSFSAAYTSTSANRSMNAFSNPSAPQSRGFVFERKIYAPQGTNAYAPRRNAQESEVIFGRRMQTRIMKVDVSSDGHVVIHEMFDGYK